jgi:hypothetical protein
MYVDIIILLILSTLMSSPLVIQQQVKTLHHLGSSAPSDFFVNIGKIRKSLKIILFGAGCLPFSYFMLFGRGSTIDMPKSEAIAIVVYSTFALFMTLSVGIFLMGVHWFLVCARVIWILDRRSVS